jgi:COP9 signalosome complex subunit 4
MFMGEVVKRDHVQEFQQSLQVHQNIRYSDGYTVLDKALIEHNIGVLSKIYMNITFAELGNFLGIKKDQAETFVAKMIAEQRINAVLDQALELVEFEEEGK